MMGSSRFYLLLLHHSHFALNIPVLCLALRDYNLVLAMNSLLQSNDIELTLSLIILPWLTYGCTCETFAESEAINYDSSMAMFGVLMLNKSLLILFFGSLQ